MGERSGPHLSSTDGESRHGKLALVLGGSWGLVLLALAAAALSIHSVAAGIYLCSSFLVWLLAYWVAYWRRKRGESSGAVWAPVAAGIWASFIGPVALLLVVVRPVRRALPPRVAWAGGFSHRLEGWAAIGIAVALTIFVGAQEGTGPVDWAAIVVFELVFAAVWILAFGWLVVASIEPFWTQPCPYCGVEIRCESEKCPRCGASLSRWAPQEGPI